MPIYEYQCQKCGHHHEALQKISDPQLRKCPDCGRTSLKRLVSAVRFRLAGSGWYETDFKSDKEGKRNLHEKGDKDEPKPEAKVEAKPEAKGDAPAAEKSEPKPAAASETDERKSRTIVTKRSAKTSPESTAHRKPKTVARKPAARRAKR